MDKTLFFYISVIVGAICTSYAITQIYKLSIRNLIKNMEKRQIEYMDALFKETVKMNNTIVDKFTMTHALIIDQSSKKDYSDGKKG